MPSDQMLPAQQCQLSPELSPLEKFLLAFILKIYTQRINAHNYGSYEKQPAERCLRWSDYAHHVMFIIILSFKLFTSIMCSIAEKPWHAVSRAFMKWAKGCCQYMFFSLSLLDMVFQEIILFLLLTDNKFVEKRKKIKQTNALAPRLLQDYKKKSAA